MRPWIEGDAVDGANGLGGSAQVDDPDRQDFQAGACLRRQPFPDGVGGNVTFEFDFDDLLAADHPQRQGAGKGHLGQGVEARRAAKRQRGAAQHALEGAQQVVVAQEAKVATFQEPDSGLGLAHGPG